MRQIMVATDGSDGAQRAVEWAAQLAKDIGFKLFILTVGGNFSVEEVRRFERTAVDLGAALDALSNEILAKAKDGVHQIGLSAIQVQAGWGDAAELIIDAAKREHADIIVVGKRGRGRLAGLLIGSVSQKVVSLAVCPVIVVP
jgi:nucleotide-binding universal stress UspA family protein